MRTVVGKYTLLAEQHRSMWENQVKREAKVRSAPARDENCLKLVPDAEQAKFFALGAQFVIVRELCQQDLRFKVPRSYQHVHETAQSMRR